MRYMLIHTLPPSLELSGAQKEQIAGYDVIECADLGDALDVAARHPTARLGSIEVRPLWEQ